ncbi:hypothetical protein [Streptomyces ziwulingensis]
MDPRTEIREFLGSRRARIAPEQAGLPAYGGNRRVKGLRRIAGAGAAKLRMEAGRDPHDEELIALVGELSTCSELFRQRWASQDVRLRRSGRKRVRHPIVGRLDLDVETLGLPAEPGLHLNIHTAPAGTPAADKLPLLASWAATRQTPATEIEPPDG